MQHDETIRHEIETMLRQRIGLNPESVGARAILRAVKKGMRTGKMRGMSDYWQGLQSSPDAFTSLVESVVVPETSFFRNRASFVFLRQWVSQEWSRMRPLRVLSLPCSTGEEPYSIAITLLEEGFAYDEFQIDAVDISALALEKAKQGIYSPYAFRRQTYRSDDKYFTLGMPEGVSQGKRITQRYFLAEPVREQVSFRQGNVLDPKLLADQPPYDIVFCRNLLIYFDQSARDRTFHKLDQLLRPNGLLFLGYAETSMINSQNYQPVPYPQTFVYRKKVEGGGGSISSSSAELPDSRDPSVPANRSPETGGKPTNAGPALSVPRTASNPEPILDSLQTAQAMADSGEIEQASAICDRCLADQPSNAKAHLLRGELYQAIGDNAAAETCYEKAIYLDPQLEPALTHLMLLKEETQDLAGASILRKRLQRLT